MTGGRTYKAMSAPPAPNFPRGRQVAGSDLVMGAAKRGASTSAVEPPRERLVYGAKVFGAFVGIAVVLGWLMYFFPR